MVDNNDAPDTQVNTPIEFTKIFALLRKHYTKHPFKEFNKNDPYRILISCILSLRTKDEVSFPATERLFKVAKTPKQMTLLRQSEIARLIYPVGFYKRKAEQIKNISKTLIEKYKSKVPDTIDELLKLKGVGRKTANLVVALGYDKAAVIVDTHVYRITNRLGWIRTKTPYETETELRKLVPNKYWVDMNGLLVLHGQQICLPRNPKCDECFLAKHCNYPKIQHTKNSNL